MKAINPLFLFLVGAFSLASGTAGFAQGGESKPNLPPLPAGPLVRGIAAEDSWTITFERTESKGRENAASNTNKLAPSVDSLVNSMDQPDKVTITSSGPYLSVRFFDNAGKNLVGFYSVSKFVFLQSVRNNDPVRTQFPRAEPGQKLLLGQEILLSAREDKIHGFDWVAPDNYVGVETIDDAQCYVFEKGNIRAWIDQKTLGPVLLKSAGEIRRLKHNGASANNDIPPDVMARIEGLRRDFERFKKSPKGG